MSSSPEHRSHKDAGTREEIRQARRQTYKIAKIRLNNEFAHKYQRRLKSRTPLLIFINSGAIETSFVILWKIVNHATVHELSDQDFVVHRNEQSLRQGLARLLPDQRIQQGKKGVSWRLSTTKRTVLKFSETGP